MWKNKNLKFLIKRYLEYTLKDLTGFQNIQDCEELVEEVHVGNTIIFNFQGLTVLKVVKHDDGYDFWCLKYVKEEIKC